MHRLPFVLACVLCLLPAAFGQGQQPVCAELTADNLTYSQDFNTLSNAFETTSDLMPIGFGFAESGSSANDSYFVSNGRVSGANTYSYGSNSNPAITDRALGGKRASALNPTIGGCFTNNSGKTITSIVIQFDGELWHLAVLGRADRLDFQYSLDATSLTTGTWIDVNELDFLTPSTATATGIRDGNAAANRQSGITSTLSSLELQNGSTIFIRWLDYDVPSNVGSGVEDGLAIDNFSLTAVTAPTSANVSISGRVLTADGRGVPFALVSISGPDIVARTARANPFGHFRFTELTNGKSYIVSVSPKSVNIAVPSRMITLNEDVTDFDFIAEPR